ncbi:MAG: Arm DNA-binding domain-containing protein [Rhizobium sp.]|nr:Arm DNA-binding domain-containing protein [Rhizobium sp.]
MDKNESTAAAHGAKKGRHVLNKLSARFVQTVKFPPKWHSDGAGLYLRVTKEGNKSWVFVFPYPGYKHPREMGLGSHPQVSLEEARRLAELARQELRNGIDPIEKKREVRQAVTKQFAPDVELRETSHNDVYTGTADGLVAAGIVPAGYFPGYPGMPKTIVALAADGSLTTRDKTGAPGGRYVEQKRRLTYTVTVYPPEEIREERIQEDRLRCDAWRRRMNALPRPAPLIDLPGLPGFRSAPKIKLVPEYRIDGNVIHLAPRSAWRAESCPA